MNKKILISSIITVCILVGVSFTSVVGYNKLESNIEVSPLFNIRTQRAIENKNSDLTCNYVGKGEDFNLLIPDRNEKIELLQKGIAFLQAMDDETFNKFVSLICSRNKQNSIDDKELLNAFNQSINNQENNETVSFPSWGIPCTIGLWIPGCYIFEFGIFLLLILALFMGVEWSSDCVSPT